MTKNEFLNLLEQRLMVLNDDERADLLSEYEQHIEMKMQSGLSEEEAIADFGDPEELIKELLEAYHLNTDYQPKNHFSANITYGVKSCAHFLSSTFESLCQMDKKSLFQSFLRLCGLGIFLGALYTVGALFCSLLHSFLVYTLPFGGSIGRAVYHLLELCLYLIYMAFTIYLIIFFIKRYILINYRPLDPPTTYNSYNAEPTFNFDFDGAKNYASNAAGEAIARMRVKAAQSKELRLAEKEGAEAKEPFKIPFPDISLSALCMKVVIWCCRFVGFFFLLFAACSALGLIAGAATAFVFVVMGYSIIGPFLIVLGCALVAIVVTALLIQFVFGIGGAKA